MDRDRLKEVRQSYNVDLEMGNIKKPVQHNDYLQQVSSIKADIDIFNAKLDQIRKLHLESFVAVSDQEIREVNGLIESLTEEARGLMQSIKGQLKVMQTMKVKNESELKILQNQYSNLKKTFMDSIMKYQNIEKQYRAAYKQKMATQYRTIRPDASEEEIEEALDTHLTRPTVFAQSVVDDARVGEAKQAIKQTQDRHLDIQKIVKSIEELNTLYTEMQYMVEQQDILVDNIEKNVESANVQIQEANVQLEQATGLAISTRKPLY
ncbi:t-SNARE [Conidiobolus coronatus NRRL 28638]|uniref:t-SNARE n=1 Tax=Conidiobolus coronatus (strain ATCC 28846 / CBS 209.66 / NRRL 28638) TaxID=796925 RepID=A0A137P9P0_CONC2|nr:t-SNARE [Conidiobolus coronatus NRRL 28638]|eukprot:KXN71674.1 t-SNARE [Conidiobolus coronatus NRRL 28638]